MSGVSYDLEEGLGGSSKQIDGDTMTFIVGIDAARLSCTMCQPGSSRSNRRSIPWRSLWLRLCPCCNRSKLDSLGFVMANSTSIVGFAKLGSVGNRYASSPAGSSPA